MMNVAESQEKDLTMTNCNFFYAGIIAETFARSGLEHVVISPGSRSMPLAVAFGTNPKIKNTVILDERSAGFFALGIAKRTHKPVALICSSGTAVANYLPAVIEAKLSKAPLIILSADRPPEMRGCHSGQTIDQVKIFGDYVNFYQEMAVPEPTSELFQNFRQTAHHALERSLFPQKGPVHLNFPFRDPLAPVVDDAFNELIADFDEESFYRNISEPKIPTFCIEESCEIVEEMRLEDRGLIVIGTVSPEDDERFCEDIGKISKALNWPIIAEGLSPMRNFSKKSSYAISNYDTVLRNRSLWDELTPKIVLQVGALPTSKTLRAFLKSSGPKTYVLEDSTDNTDALHGASQFIRASLKNFVQNFDFHAADNDYLKSWMRLNEEVNEKIVEALEAKEELFEGKIAFLLSKYLPEKTPVFVATSMPVRDVESFWQKNDSEFRPYFNRGANGIDGIFSTALGVAHGNRPTVILTGDLTLLHDTNGFLITKELEGSLTIVLINNDGGGIFENLPIAKFSEVFERFVATPQSIAFDQLAKVYDVDYQEVKSWNGLIELIKVLPESGVRLIEIKTNRKEDVIYRNYLLSSIYSNLKL